MSSSGAAAGLGLLSAASWGGSDFAGGWGARRASSLLVTASGQIVSLAALLIVCLALRVALPGTSYLIYAAIGGFEGAIALGGFLSGARDGSHGAYRRLDRRNDCPGGGRIRYSSIRVGPMRSLLLAWRLGWSAIWLISHSPKSEGADTSRSALLLGAGAGVGFGAQLILFKAAAAGGVLWALTSGRVAGVGAILLVIAIAPPVGPWRGFWLAGIVSGSLDTVGNLFYMLASQLGRLDAAAVICSMYPAGTIVLAGIILRERPTSRQVAGMGLALAAVALLAA